MQNYRVNDRDIVIITVFLMTSTLVVPSIKGPLIHWSKVTVLHYLRTFIWLLGALTLPGYLITKKMRLAEKLSDITILNLSLHISIIIIGLSCYILYVFSITFSNLPYIIISVIIITFLMDINKINYLKKYDYKNKYNIIFLLSLIILIIISALIQYEQEYLIPGDLWVSVKSAVQIISLKRLHITWNQQYPFFFGFILTSLSTMFGIPLVNTYVLMFPLIILNSISFYSFLKEYYKINTKQIVITNLFYVFSGGLGYLVNILLYDGSKYFWTISYITQDMYSRNFFWYNIEFTYKVLSITFIYTSIILLNIMNEFEDYRKRLFLITTSSILLILAFYIHMIDVIPFIPLYFYFIYQDRINNYKNFITFILATIIIFILTDYGFHFYYINLSLEKIIRVLIPQLSRTKTSIFFYLVIITFLLGLNKFNIIKTLYDRYYNKTTRVLFTFLILVIYVLGIEFWFSFEYPITPLYKINYFPWQFYVFRFGFVGLFSVLSLFIYLRNKGLDITFFWALFIICVGSVFWGSRIVDYLTPILSYLSAYLIIKLSRLDSKLTFGLKNSRFVLNLDLAQIIKPLLVFAILLSFTSQFYGASYYMNTGPGLSEEDTELFLWIYYNTPVEVSVIVPNNYNILLGVLSFSDRVIIQERNLDKGPTLYNERLDSLIDQNVQYLLLDRSDIHGPFIDWLMENSQLVYKSPRYKIYEIY